MKFSPDCAIPPPRHFKRILRAIAPKHLQIIHTVTALGVTGRYLAQVVVCSQDGSLEGFGSAVSSSWHVAQRNAIVHCIEYMCERFDRVRSELKLPIDECLSNHMASRFERHLAIEGGVWVEEAARPPAKGRTRRLFGSMPAIQFEGGDSLFDLATNYE